MRPTATALIQLIAFSVALGEGVLPPPAREVPRVRSRSFELDYAVNEAGGSLTGVALWYTVDCGVTWNNYGCDSDGESPFAFVATEQGLFGFYLVARNEAGASSDPPQSGTEPHHWAFVDYTPPVVQLHSPRAAERSGQRTLAIRWTAIDAHLPSRPIELDYRVVPDGPWTSVCAPLANTGRFDWRLGADVGGRIMLRLTVCDRGGNRSQSAVGAIDLDAVFSPGSGRATSQPARATHEPTDSERDRAYQLYLKGSDHLGEGRHRLAISRLRDALQLNPRLPAALEDLGHALYAVGSFEDSVNAFSLSLDQDPARLSALSGVSEALIATRRYEEAASRLRAWIERDPESAKAWLQLGRVATRRGDELTALDAYQRAATLDPEAKEIVAQAKRYLEAFETVRQQVGPVVTKDEPEHP